MRISRRVAGISMLSSALFVSSLSNNASAAPSPARAAAPTTSAVTAGVAARSATGVLTGTVQSRAGTRGRAARAVTSGGGRVQVAYHRLGSGEDVLKPYSTTIARNGSFSLPVPAFGKNERVIAMVTAWQGGQVLHSTGLLTSPRGTGGRASFAGRDKLVLTFTRDGKGASIKDGLMVPAPSARSTSKDSARAYPPFPPVENDCTWHKYPNTGDPYYQLVPLWRAHTAGNVFLDFTYKDESNTEIEVGFESKVADVFKITGSYAVANKSGTESSLRVTGGKDRWVYGTFLYTYWWTWCRLAPDGRVRKGDYLTATQESWTGELVESSAGGPNPRRDVTRCVNEASPHRVLMSRNANNPWTRTSSRTANNKWKFSYLDNNLVGAITTMQSAQVTAKYSLSSGSAYLCGDNKPPTTAPTIFSTGT